MTYKTLQALLESHSMPPHVEEWLQKNAPHQYEDFKRTGQARFYRGMDKRVRATTTAIYLPGVTEYRPARNTGDAYKVIIDYANPGAPRRGWSTPTSTDPEHAGDYGSYIFAIFPPDDVKVGVASHGDIWDTQIFAATLDLLNAIQLMADYFDLDEEPVYEEFNKTTVDDNTPVMPDVLVFTTERLFAMANDAMRDADDRSGVREELVEVLQACHKHVRTWILDRFDGGTTNILDFARSCPLFRFEKNGFKITTASQQPIIERNAWGKEAWFEGPFVAIRMTNDMIHKAMGDD